MFTQIDKNLLKNPLENKSWFRDSENGCDLFIWLDEYGQIIHFQLWHEDFLVEWELNSGIKTGQLDSSEGSFHNLQSPSYHYHQTYLSEPVKKIRQFIEPAHTNELENKLIFIRYILKKA